MAASDAEWRILQALAEQPVTTPALKQRLSWWPPLSRRNLKS